MSASTAIGAAVARVGSRAVVRRDPDRTARREARGVARARRERELGTRAALSGFFHRHGGAGAGVRAGTHAAMLGRAAKRRGSGRGARSVTTMGLPIPIIGGLFNPAVMSIVYVFVAVKLFLGFDKTNYSADKKVVMTALWPLLAATNPSFRENLKRATMG